jgi:hypothetical protein
MNTPQTAKDTYNFCLVFSNMGERWPASTPILTLLTQ